MIATARIHRHVIRRMVVLFDRGLSVSEIGQMLGRSSEEVRRCLFDSGRLSTRPLAGPPVDPSVPCLPEEVLSAIRDGAALTDEQQAAGEEVIARACVEIRNRRGPFDAELRPVRTSDVAEHKDLATWLGRVRDLRQPKRCRDCGAKIVRGAKVEGKFVCAACAHELDRREVPSK